MNSQKVVIVCRIRNKNKLYNRKRTTSNDIAGSNIVIFNNTQIKYLKSKTKYFIGDIHLENTRTIEKRKNVPLSTCTYRNMMRFANNYMINNKNKLYIGPAYTKNDIITDFQTVVTGTIESDEINKPNLCAIREIEEEIGLTPLKIELLDTTSYGNMKVFTLIADL